MTSFSRTAGGIGAGLLTVAALTAATPAAQAQSAAKAAVVNVPCDSTALFNAVTTANATPTVPTTLRLASYCVYSLTTATALPSIAAPVTMLGGRSTSLRRAAGTTAFPILQVAATTGNLRVEGIFILNGSAATSGGGIQNAGTLVLNHVTLSGNKTTAAAANGGGLYNAVGGTALVSHSLIMGNATTVAATDGGGIYNDGSLTVYQSRVTGNVSAGNGGGIFTAATRTTRLMQSTISGNHALLGGGLYNSGTTTLDRTLVALNRATDTTATGGGILNNTGGTVTLSNSIVGKNTPVNCEPAIVGCTG